MLGLRAVGRAWTCGPPLLRAHLRSYLRQVAEGEKFRVTHRGRVIARTVPEQSRRAQALAALTKLSKTARPG